MQGEIIFLFAALLILALLIPWVEGLLGKGRYIALTVIALGLAFALRAWFMDYQSGDYNTFLSKWVQYFRDSGGFQGLSTSVGNYNFPYLYLLAAFSYIPLSDLHLIKLSSIFFDLVLAFGMMKLAGVFTRSVPKRLGAYLITLLLPTVVINGAMWGQCDSIYVSFIVLALWLVLSGRPKLSMVCMALSFGFKLQAVFIMPLFLILLFAKKIKFWHFFIFPVSYIILIMPAVLMGRPFMDAFMLYFNQADTVGSGLNYNSPSVFALIDGRLNAAALSAIGIAAAFLFVFFLIIRGWSKRNNLSNEALLGFSILFAIGIPFLLPHMHDRYFYMADVLTVMPFILYKRYTPVMLLTSFASFICYYSYLNQIYLLPLSYGAAALIGVLLIMLTFTEERLSVPRVS
jgi:Gpi18-like mannosyltransferase